MWRHTRRGDEYITVITDLTPVRAGTGPARLLDMLEGRSKQVFKSWLDERDPKWRSAIEIVAMEGFTDFKTATAEYLPDAVAVLDPFHALRIAGEAPGKCRGRVQQPTRRHRGRARDPSTPRGALCTPCSPSTSMSKSKRPWGVYQWNISAARPSDSEPDQLHPPLPLGDPRIQAPATPSILRSPQKGNSPADRTSFRTVRGPSHH